MSTEAERPFISAAQAWGDAVSEHSDQSAEREVELLRQGYSLFFDTVREIPGLEVQPKHWSDYREEEIDFVTHRPVEFSSGTERTLHMRIGEVLGFYLSQPIRIGVFDVRKDKSESYSNRYSASTVVESTYGEIFRSRIVLHLSFESSDRAQNWYEGHISYDLFGIRGDQLDKIQRAGEMDLLLAANAAVALFAEEFRQMQKTPLTPSP